jgi:uncharacterized protein YkwD
MKKLAIFFLLSILTTLNFQNVCAQSQPYKRDQLKNILEKSTSDSVAMIERLSAYYFHGIMNDYRVRRGRKTVMWSDELWMVCINHNFWMTQCGKLSHDERYGEGFSGREPGDRIDYCELYVAYEWCGENCLYNYDIYGETIEEIAFNIASHSFEQWKESPGHNENMLTPGAKIQGVSFVIDGDRVWATELLCTNELESRLYAFQKPASPHFKCRNYETMKSLNKD